MEPLIVFIFFLWLFLLTIAVIALWPTSHKSKLRKQPLVPDETFKSVRGFKSDYQDEPHDGELKYTTDGFVAFDMGLRSFAIGMPRTSNPYLDEKWKGMHFDWYHGWDEGLKANRIKFQIKTPAKQTQFKSVQSSHQ